MKNVLLAVSVIFCSVGLTAQDIFSGAQWIAPTFTEDTAHRPVVIFRKNIDVQQKIKSAKLFITALGLYEAQLNGKRIGDAYFTPGWTNYDQRLQYQEYEVSSLLKAGKNTFDVSVGEGWYRGVFRGGQPRNNYGNEAGLLVALYIIYADGSRENIVSDHSWQCSKGPILFSELYDGELFDSRIAADQWSAVKVIDHAKNILIPSESEPVKKHERFSPVNIFITPRGEQVVDFGQNIAGWVQIKVRGQAGDTIRIYHAEVLDTAGNFYTGNLRTAKAFDTYILTGQQQMLEPHFTYHGFRYAKVEGFTATKNNCTAIALYSDLKKTGTFSCSDTLLNRLQRNIEWSMKSNFFDIPTDCPQRSERLGWGGDAQVFCRAASYNMDTRLFFAKWLRDLSSEQGKNGGVPTYIPTMMSYTAERFGVAGWGDAATIVPWTMFQVYNDTGVLREQYPSMKLWVDYIVSVSPDGLWKNNGYGDWYAAGPPTFIPLIDQCFWAYSTSILINAAQFLGHSADADFYKQQLQEIKNNFVKAYWINDTLVSNTQTAYILALQFDVLPDSLRGQAVRHLVELIHANNDHLATGVLGTPYLLFVLHQYGYTDLAFQLLQQRTYPSWLYPVTRGATTIWEKWDGIPPGGDVQATSYNHYAFGAVGDWLYRIIAGIEMAAPGYQQIIIQPHVGGGLHWVKSSYDCDYGKIVSNWRVVGKKIFMQVEIPKGTTATVSVPGKDNVQVNAGKYSFEGFIQ